MTSVWRRRSGKCWLHAPCTMLGVRPAPGATIKRAHNFAPLGRSRHTSTSCASKESAARAGLYILIEEVTVCGKVTPVILHGVVAPENTKSRRGRRKTCSRMLNPRPPWRQPSDRWMVSFNFHTNATSKRWHLGEIDLRFALNSTLG